MNDAAGYVDVIVRTRNSASTLRSCLESAIENLPVRKILVIDNYSTDSTKEIADYFKAEFHEENVGLGYATRLGIELAETTNIVFLDSDVVITDGDFYAKAQELLSGSKVGAVVGQAQYHFFEYGLPLSLTVFPLKIAREITFDSRVKGRETYFIQKHLRSKGLRVRYVTNAMIHYSTHRNNRNWPEWQGAWVRKTSGLRPREIMYSMLVVFLMLSNSRKLKNFLYIPIFQAKIIRGLLHPDYWSHDLPASACEIKRDPEEAE